MYGVECAREVWIDVSYKGGKGGRKPVEFLAVGKDSVMMIEVKAKGHIEDADHVQALSCPKACGYHVGLLINFGSKQNQIKWLAN